MKGQGTQASCLGDLECLDHLDHLAPYITAEILKMIKVLNIRMAGSLSTLPISMRSARKKSCARLQRTSTDVM